MNSSEVTRPLSPQRSERLGPPVVLVLDPEQTDADLTVLGQGWATEMVVDAASVLEVARARRVGALLVAPSIDAERRELLTRVLKKRQPAAVVVHLSTGDLDDARALAQSEGADGVAPWPVADGLDALSRLLAEVPKASSGAVPAAVPLEALDAAAYRRGPIRCLVGVTQPDAGVLSDSFGESTVEVRRHSSFSQAWPSAESHFLEHARTLVERLAVEGRPDDARTVRRLLAVAEEAMNRFADVFVGQQDGGPATALLVGLDDALGEHLARGGVGVELATNVIEATTLISHQTLDLVLVEQGLAPALLSRVRRQLNDHALPIVVLLSGDDTQHVVNLGADATVPAGDLSAL